MTRTEYTPTATGSYKTRAGNNIGFSPYSNVITLYSLSRNLCRVRDVFPEPEEWGIFSLLEGLNNDMSKFLKSTKFEPTLLDIEYVLNHSGAKKISALLASLIRRNDVNESGEYPLTMETYTKIASIVSMRYTQKWSELWKTLSYEYDPLSPYELTVEEQGTDSMNTTRTVKVSDESTTTIQKTGEVSTTDNGTETVSGTHDNKSTVEDKRTVDTADESSETAHASGNENTNGENSHYTFGFNGANAVGGDEAYRDTNNSATTTDRTQTDTLNRTSSEKHGGTETTTENGTDSKSTERSDTQKTDTTENGSNVLSGTHNTDETYERTNPTTRSITRNGNIGNLTRQELIAKQRELLQWQFLDVVFDDLDKVLSCGAY